MTSAQHTIDTLAARLVITRWRGRVADARCPAHDDSHASLTIGFGDNGGVVVHCHAGCDARDVMAAIGMTMADLSPEPHVVATYQYCDEYGRELYQVQRWEPKDFRCVPGLPPRSERRLYRSEWLRAARKDNAVVYVVEGEKDCETLAQAGEYAVCGVGGAGKWLPHYSGQLEGLDVVVIADNDEPGHQHARDVVRALDGVAAGVALVSPSYGKDVTDQLEAGYSLDTLVPMSMEETLEVLRADMVRERPVSWLWEGYLPAGKMIMIEGDPGDGKSVMTCDLAARFSTGAPLPDGSKTNATDVIMISAEDDPEDTIRPRLRVAGADLRRVHLVVGGAHEGSAFDLARDLPALELLVSSTNCKVVFIDPLMAFMPAAINAYSDHEVRRALHPLARMAQRNGTAIIVVRHLTKGRTKAITAGGGSIAFIGAARAGYLVGPHPEDDTKRVLTPVKMNIGQLPAALGYQVCSSNPDDPSHCPPVVRWDDEPLEMSAQDVLDGGGPEGRGAYDMAIEFLVEALSENHSGMKWEDIVKAGKREGHSEATLRRARVRVAELVRNPLDATGTMRKGAFWILKEGTEGVGCIAGRATPSDSDTPSEQPALYSVPLTGGCEVCGNPDAITFDEDPPVRRCLSHSPYTYGAS